MKINVLCSWLLICCLLCIGHGTDAKNGPVRQVEIPLVSTMPDMPTPYKMKDWKAIAVAQDRLLYDFNAKGPLMPLGWWDDSEYNFPGTAFGICSYVGQNRTKRPSYVYESLPVMGSVLGATLAGIDKSSQNGIDYVSMLRQFYTKRSGLNLIQNSPNRKNTGASFWYEIFPGMIFSMICDLYPENEELSGLMLANAKKWRQAISDLGRGRDFPDFDLTGYDFATRKGTDNGIWKEPDGAAGLAWLEYAAWVRSGNRDCLDAALDCMEFLENRDAAEGPYYEIMMPYGAYLAVRLNAETGSSFDEMKMLSWCFDGNNSDRDGWGVVSESWNGYDVHGLVGQKKYESYAFAMNTFSQVAALIPIVKYNPAYSHTIAKWVLNAANASRLFYADEHPANRQTSAIWKGDPQHVICYEGLRNGLKGNRFEPFIGVLASEGPYAVGDQVKNFNSFTDICPYGSSWSGIMAAVVAETDVEGILQLDCNATDYFGDRALPRYLVFNPHSASREVTLMFPSGEFDVFDIVSGEYAGKNVSGTMRVRMDAGQTMNIVCVPAGTVLKTEKGRLMAGEHIVMYQE